MDPLTSSGPCTCVRDGISPVAVISESSSATPAHSLSQCVQHYSRFVAGIGCRSDSASSARRQTRALTHPRRPHRPRVALPHRRPHGLCIFDVDAARGYASVWARNRCAPRRAGFSHTVGTMAPSPSAHPGGPGSAAQWGPRLSPVCAPRRAGFSHTVGITAPSPSAHPGGRGSVRARVAGQVPAVARILGRTCRRGSVGAAGAVGAGEMNRPHSAFAGKPSPDVPP